MLCKAKAVWLETSAASDPAPHDEKDVESGQRCLQGVSRGNGTLSAQIWTVFASSSAPTDTLQPLLHSLWSCPLCPAATGVTRQLRDGTETPSSGAQKRAPLCDRKYSSLCLCHDQGMNKEQRCQTNKELGAPYTHAHAVVHGSPGVTRILSTPLAMSLLRPSSSHSCLGLVPWHRASTPAGGRVSKSNARQMHTEWVEVV